MRPPPHEWLRALNGRRHLDKARAGLGAGARASGAVSAPWPALPRGFDIANRDRDVILQSAASKASRIDEGGQSRIKGADGEGGNDALMLGVLPEAVGRHHHDARAELGMLLVPASRLAVSARNGLALPVDQLATDGVVAMARRRRKLPARLVEREGQEIGLRVLCPVDTGLPEQLVGQNACFAGPRTRRSPASGQGL